MLNKRILSFLLAVVLVVGLMPTSVFATENEGEPTPNPVIEPGEGGETPDADGIAPLTEEGDGLDPQTGDGTVIPQTGEGEEGGEGASLCTVCNEPGCEKTHTQCEACGTWDCETEHSYCEKCAAWDCGKAHVVCEICKVEDCGQEHKQCNLCGEYDCDGEHKFCEICKEYNCGKTHGIPCMICGGTDCGKTHIKCGTCGKYDCEEHKVTEPTEPEGTEGETEPTETTAPEEDEEDVPFVDVLLEIDNLSDLLIEICKEENMDALLALTGEEILKLELRVEELYAEIENPSTEETRDWNDLRDTLAILPNAPKIGEFWDKEHMPDWGALLSADDVKDLLTISKNVSQGTDSDYKLTLDAYTTMEISGKITDLVLVLDQSGSMFHAADVDNTRKTFVSQGTGSTKKTYSTYINNSMTFDQMEAQAKKDIANGNNGASMTGYYMARVGNKLYALRRDENGYWWRTDDYDYSPADGEGSTIGYPGTADVEEGQVKRHSKYANHTWTQSGHDQAQCYKSIYGVTYDALQAFLNKIKGTPNLRVAVVGFAGGTGQDWEGTGVYLDGQWLQFEKNFDYDSITTTDYFKETWDPEEMASLEASIDAFWPRRNATATSAGFNIASELFEGDGGDEDESKKNHIILLFSDGQPTQGDPTTVVNNLKTGWNKNGKYETGYITEIYTVGPACLHSDIGALGAWATDSNHYAAPTIENMNATFEKIASSIIATTLALDGSAYLYDEITPSFQLPQELLDAYNAATTDAAKEAVLKDNIKVYTADAVFSGDVVSFGNKVLFSDAKLTLNDAKTGVEVSNFGYSSNYVTKYGYKHPKTGAENYHGCKLIVEIPIDVKPDFLGGDNVYTNTTDSGIFYASGEAVKNFSPPDVDINVSTINPLYTAKDIYISQAASLPDIIKLGEYHQNDQDWKVDGINNDYVNIVYTVTDPTGASMTYTIPAGTAYSSLTDQGWSENAATHPLLKEDTTYTVTCQVVSTGNANNKSQGTANPEVKVYKPEITFQDSAINLGQTANYEDQANTDVTCNFVEVIWKHGETAANVETMGAAPTLEYGYTPAAAAFTDDTNVKVTVTAKSNGGNVPLDQDITQYVTFYRDACDYEDCEHDQTAQVSATDANRVNFVVHIKSFDLKITKDVDGTIEDPNQSFLFHVTGPDGFDMKVMVVGENSVTIKGLPAGVYTVTELTDWSWRYICTDDAQKEASAADAVEGVTTVTFTNKLDENKWLSGDSFAENQWSGSGITANKSN